MERDQRRLAAIVSADVAGYSRLMGQDESGTLAALKAYRRELIDPKIAEYGGRIVKTTGDGLLLEFPSVVEAVRCAVDMQRGLAARNADVPANQKIEFRIGINVGDIIIDGDDIYGDGVNVAARLEALAEPGQICVSKVVRDQVLDKLNFGFEELGEQQVKNIARPVEVYQIRDDGSAPARASIAVKSRRLRALGWAVAALAMVAVGIVAWWQLPRWVQKTPVPPAFSVAVMPFTAATGNQDEVQFANALTQDVVTMLGEDRLIGMASPRTVQSHKDNRVDVRTLGRELNVRYLVDGEVRSGENKMAIALRLIDAESGSQLWSDELVIDTSAEQSGAPANRVRLLLAGVLRDKEIQRALAHPDPGSAVDRYLQGQAALRNADSVAKLVAVRKYYDEALRIDPNFLPAQHALGDLLDLVLSEDLESDQSTFASRVDELDRITKAALYIDDRDSTSWYERAGALGWLGRWDQALTANAKARKLAPGVDAELIAQHAFILLSLDRPEEALAVAQRATVTSTIKGRSNEGYAHQMVCMSSLLLGRYEGAVTACERAAANDSWWTDQVYLAAAYAQLRDSAKSAAAKSALLSDRPGFTIEKLKTTMNWGGAPGYQQRLETHLYAGLRKAGLPEK